MTPRQRNNLKRLLSPQHIAFIGGASAALAAQQCVDAGFAGPIWGVNPRRSEMAGRPCFASIEALPEPPDAVFVAVPREAAIETIAALAKVEAGGAVCYTAGFRETGADGATVERALVAASGDLALVGPNCLGLLNYVDRAILWPFAHGGQPVRRGVAIVSQSGMLCSNLTMSQRSVPFSYLISAGNQSVIGIEDLIDVLLEKEAVSAVGLYVEGLRDVSAFSETAVRALERNVPLVALKAGRSETGARVTVTHTGSLSGTDQLFDVLFERLDIIRVQSPAELLESVKMLNCAGAPTGNRIAAFTCSGGDAALLADLGEARGLSFPQPSPLKDESLRALLPPIATVANPLDYTTPLWGKGDVLEQVFGTMIEGAYDAAVIVQDYMRSQFVADNEFYLADSRAFIAAARRVGIPGAIVTSIPENLPESTRRLCVEGGVAPLQGIETAVAALAGAVAYGTKRLAALRQGLLPQLVVPAVVPVDPKSAAMLDEWQGKQLLAAAGIAVPAGRLTDAAGAAEAAASIGYPVAVKLVSADLAHKTEFGAVRLGLSSPAAVEAAIGDIVRSVARCRPGIAADRFIIERMIERPIAELLVGIRHDPLFGQVMVVGAGGTLVEIMRDIATLILPADRASIRTALTSLRIATLFDGYRGAPSADIGRIVDAIARLADFAIRHRERLLELDVNPLMILPDRVVAADALVRIVPAS
jgi:acyl-CoA synthetase (NDP forming)